MVALVSELVREESPSRVPETQEGVLSILAEALEELAYDVKHLPGERSGGHLHATPRDRSGEGPSQLILGHCDTVWPLGSLQEMPLQVDGRRVRGPGVYDMKAGLAQMVYALKSLHEIGLRPHVTPQIFINSDEEVGSDESTPYIVDLARQCNRAFVLEPSLGPRGRLKTRRKGVGRFTVTLHGRSAHAGLEPEKGASAILGLSYLIQELFALNDPERGITVNVGTVEGGMRPNVVAATSQAVVDVRVPTEEDARRVEEAILNLSVPTEGVEVEIEGGINRMPLERTPRNQALWRAAWQLGRQMDLSLQQATAGGASDGNTTSQYTATLDGLGPVGDGAHAVHEFVYIDKMVERAALLAALLMAPPMDWQAEMGGGPA